MTTELTYLFLTSLLLTLAWVPHIVGQVMVQGLLTPNAHVLEVSTSTTAMAAAVYFWSRVAHFVVFIAGVTVLMARTVIFTVSWIAILALAAAVWTAAA